MEPDKDSVRAGWLPVLLVWAGIAGAGALLALDLTAPAPRLDVLAALALAALGAVAHFRADRSRCAQAVRRTRLAAPAAPPRALRIATRWPVANGRLLLALTTTALAVPLVLGYEWALALADGEQAAEPATALLGGAVVAGYLLVWSTGRRRVVAAESAYVTQQVESAVAGGVARVLPVTVGGWGAGVHRRHPEGAMPVARIAARKGRDLGERLQHTRVPHRSWALRLTVPGQGERTLFLAHRVPAEGLAAALHQRQGWLYRVPSGLPGDPSWTAPALLALGDGRYVQGWTQDAPDRLVPDGPELRACHTAPVTAELHPPEPALLRHRPPFRPGAVLHSLAFLLVASALVGGFWDDHGPGRTLPLTAGALLSVAALLSAALARAVTLHRATRTSAATAPHPTPPPPVPPPPAPSPRMPR